MGDFVHVLDSGPVLHSTHELLEWLYDELDDIEEGIAESGADQGHGVEDTDKWCWERIYEIEREMQKASVAILVREDVTNNAGWMDRVLEKVEDLRRSVETYENTLSQDDHTTARILKALGESVGCKPWQVDDEPSWNGLEKFVDHLNIGELHAERFETVWEVTVRGSRGVGASTDEGRKRALAKALLEYARGGKR